VRSAALAVVVADRQIQMALVRRQMVVVQDQETQQPQMAR
jgi:hypothetical protein